MTMKIVKFVSHKEKAEKILEAYRSLPPEKQQRVMSLIDDLDLLEALGVEYDKIVAFIKLKYKLKR